MDLLTSAIQQRMKKLNIGLIGYGFMGRAHSNAYRKVGNFFDLEYQPVLKAVCARDESKVKAYPAGTFYSEPPKTPHYVWAKEGEVIIKTTGMGPTAINMIPQKQ